MAEPDRERIIFDAQLAEIGLSMEEGESLSRRQRATKAVYRALVGAFDRGEDPDLLLELFSEENLVDAVIELNYLESEE